MSKISPAVSPVDFSPPPPPSALEASTPDYDHGPIQADSSLLTSQNYLSLPLRVIIPSVSIDLPIRPAQVIKGKWEVFEDSASFGLGSASPGTVGNSVVFAHARKGYFLPLRGIKKDNLIYILTTRDWYTYRVDTIKEVLPTDISVIAPTDDETLTLYTCSGFADSKRIIVAAKRIK